MSRNGSLGLLGVLTESKLVVSSSVFVGVFVGVFVSVFVSVFC